MWKLTKREQEVVELLAQGLEPKSHCDEIVHYHRVDVPACGANPE
jgi:hypothetical protein